MAPHRLLIFGDQSASPCSTIKELQRQAQDSPALCHFLDATEQRLRSQWTQATIAERGLLRQFESFSSLVERYTHHKDAVVSGVLHCTAQLGSLILLVENDPSVLTTFTSVHLLGFCTGLLPAAAAATAKSTKQLLKLAPTIVSLSLYLSLAAHRRSWVIEPSSDSWTMVVSDITAETIRDKLKGLQSTNAYPSHKRAYISAEVDSFVSISGPPSTLELVAEHLRSHFHDIPMRLPITAAYHASHLPKPDLDMMLRCAEIPDLPIREKMTFVSTSSGDLYDAQSLHQVLNYVHQDIFHHPISWSNSLQRIKRLVREDTVIISAVGPTNMSKALHRGLNQDGVDAIEAHQTIEETEYSIHNKPTDVAVIGMAGRFPGGEDLDQFWETISKGHDTHTKIPADRFDFDKHYDPTGDTRNATTSPYGCFLSRPGKFDVNLFNISPREAKTVDPTQRLLLMTAYEALERAGYSNHQGRRIGTFFGQATDDYRETNAGQNIDLYYIPGGMRAFGPGRLNYHFKWDGPSYSIDTACSSSAAALEFAYNALVTGDCDMALAGGGNILSGPQMFAGLSRGGFLSPTGGCKTFSDDADGYCRGEGVGVVVLKRLDRAIAEGDNVEAVIKSIATNHSAHAASITHPHSLTQERLYKQVLQKALLKPEDVQYIEMHGTGTQAGDRTEVESVASVFGQRYDSPLYIGAVKSNVGHGEGAAGITSLIKCILMLEHNLIPPHPGIEARLNRHFPPLSEKNIHIPQGSLQFTPSTESGKRRILINNFNATGGNTSLLIEDPPPSRKPKVESMRSPHVVTVSAKSQKSLEYNKRNLVDYLGSHSEVGIENLSYTTTARRMHHNFRKSYRASNTVDLIHAIEDDLGNKSSDIHRPLERSPIVFLFTGQGSHYPGMAKDLFESCEMFRKRIFELDSIVVSLQLPSFLETIRTGGQAMTCLSSVQTQIALVALEIALVDFWKSLGIIPDMVLGHSLGEYAALCTAGVLSVYDTIFLVGNRARLMETYCTPYEHGMLSIASDLRSVENYLNTGFTTCDIACINSATATVVSGPMQDLIALKDSLGHTRSTMLKVPFAFHSSQVDPILSDFRRLTAAIQFHTPQVPVISTVTAEKVKSQGVFGPEYLIRQSREPVRFSQAVEECQNHGIDEFSAMWLEIGPSPVCLGMLRSIQSIDPDRMFPTLSRRQSCWDTVTHGLSCLYDAGVDIRWSEYFREQSGSLHLFDLPTYAFDLQNYWIPYEGDWALMKSTPQEKTSTTPRFVSTCLHRVEEEMHGNNYHAITFVSDLTDTALLETIDGHRVNGLGLCPSSVYTDMALSAASYMQQNIKYSSVSEDMSVMHLRIGRPLVVPQSCDRYDIKVHCEYLEDKSRFEITFRSQTDQGPQEHGRCIVGLGQHTKWKDEWRRTVHLINSRITSLSGHSRTGSTHRILKDMVYKLFSRVVTYGQRYRSLREVFLDSEDYEAAATVQFIPNAQTDEFTISPYWVDGIIHLGGFSLNAHPNVPDDLVYISTGWDDLCIAAPLSTEKQYRSYVRMQDSGYGLYIGDVYLLDGDTIVAVCVGLRFQEMKSSSLHAILQSTTKAATPLCTSESTRKQDIVLDSQNSTIKPCQILPSSTESVFRKVQSIIAEEINMDSSNISENVRFDELGIDSILRMPIVSKIQEEMNIYLSLSALDDYPTLAALRGHIQDMIGMSASNGSSNDSSSMSPIIVSTPSTQHESMSSDLRTPPSEIAALGQQFHSRSILLSGSAINGAPTLFLMPDGAGSSSSYAMLPALPHGIAVYGLESPFGHQPLEWNCSFDKVATMYVDAIRQIQPHGPYMLGGWSLGGIHAYEVARQLLHAGEKVKGLLLIDTPNPNFLGHISDPVVELLEDTGIMAAAKWVNEGKGLELKRIKGHMCKCVDSLKHYVPDPMGPDSRPDHVFAIWAADGVEQWNDKLLQDPGKTTATAKEEVRQLQRWMKWRTMSFGPNGWDRMVGEVECHVVEGDHLSILRPPWVENTGHLVAEAVDLFLSRDVPSMA